MTEFEETRDAIKRYHGEIGMISRVLGLDIDKAMKKIIRLGLYGDLNIAFLSAPPKPKPSVREDKIRNRIEPIDYSEDRLE